MDDLKIFDTRPDPAEYFRPTTTAFRLAVIQGMLSGTSHQNVRDYRTENTVLIRSSIEDKPIIISSKERAKGISNWMLGDVARLLNLRSLSLEQSKLEPHYLVELVDLIEGGTLSTTLAKTVLEKSFDMGQSPTQVVKDNGYTQISDSSVVEEAVKQAVAENPKAVDDYMKGKETAAKFLVGQVMRITKGKANPAVVVDLVKKELDALQQG